MSDIFDEARKNIETRGLLRPGQRVLVAVSGGVDSMVLLDVLNRLRREQRWQVTVAHLNHGLRGRSSDADERLVRRIARERGLTIEAGKTDVGRLAKKAKLSIEMAARKARHEFLAQVAHKLGIRSIALAHHADDQVELFFLRLFRGSGGEGLSGMKWRNTSPACRDIEAVRPLLSIPKSALQEYALENRIPFREDATNRSLDMQRNRIRQELLPLIRKKYQPAIASTVLRAAEIVSGEAEYVTNAAQDWLKSRRVAFAKLPLAVQRRVLQSQLVERGVTPEYDLIERLRASPGEVVCAMRLAVFRDENGTVRLREIETDKFRKESRSVSIVGPKGQIRFGSAMIEWVVSRQRRFPQFRPGCEFFDADKVGSRITLRHWRPGDRFQPIGMAKAVKVQDLLVNQKVPKELRKGLIVAVTRAGEIFWVEKLRISEQFRLFVGTKRRLQWCWQRF